MGLYFEYWVMVVALFLGRGLEEQSPVMLGDGVAAPQMPAAFTPELETHFGAQFRHWKSPVRRLHYVDFK